MPEDPYTYLWKGYVLGTLEIEERLLQMAREHREAFEKGGTYLRYPLFAPDPGFVTGNNHIRLPGIRSERLMLPYGVLWCMAVEATIKVTPEVKGRLDKLKNYPRETYNEVIDRLTRDALEESAEELTDEDICDIEEAIADIKAGRVYTTEELKMELGID